MQYESDAYDENPEPTLSLRISPPDGPPLKPKKISLPAETNAFAWNNMRVKHSSEQGLQKVLLYFVGGSIDFKRLDVLLERSIAKYADHVQMDDTETKYYG